MTAEPIPTEEILADDHRHADENGIGDTQQTVASQTVAAEDETANDGLEQIVGQAHASECAQMTERTTHAIGGIPAGNNRRDNHTQDGEVIDRVKPDREAPEIHKAQRDDSRSAGWLRRSPRTCHGHEYQVAEHTPPTSCYSQL